jgi:uncharacterized protein
MTDLSGPEAHWRAALAAGQFLIQRSRADGEYFFPPRVMAPGTGNDDLEWVKASGGGTIYSFTKISPKPPAEPYAIVLVDLDEGPRLMSRIEGMAADQVEIGARVEARIGKSDDAPILLFDPA